MAKLDADIVRKAMKEALAESIGDSSVMGELEEALEALLKKDLKKDVKVRLIINREPDSGLFDIDISVQEENKLTI